jgi:hypothetical protein
VQASGIVDRRIHIRSPRLEQQDAQTGVDEAAGCGATGGPAADNDHIWLETRRVIVTDGRWHDPTLLHHGCRHVDGYWSLPLARGRA